MSLCFAEQFDNCQEFRRLMVVLGVWFYCGGVVGYFNIRFDRLHLVFVFQGKAKSGLYVCCEKKVSNHRMKRVI